MGMYTELYFNSELRSDTPQSVIATLRYMIGELDDAPELLDHSLFSTQRWRFMLRCDSYYFDADTRSTLRLDDLSDDYYLNIQCNLKNYDGEIQKFIDWIAPYCDKYPGEFLGFYRYEEDEIPTLVHMGRQGAVCQVPTSMELVRMCYE